jgi:peroxiredoxin
VIFGVNPASAEKHKDYCESFNFPFRLLSDEGLAVTKAYGTVNDKGTGVARSVVVVGKDGNVKWSAPGMPSDEEILAALG